LAVLAALGAAPNSGSAPVGSAAPPIRGTTMAGTPLAPAATAGKITILTFGPVGVPVPGRNARLERGLPQLHARDVTFLGIDTTRPRRS